MKTQAVALVVGYGAVLAAAVCLPRPFHSLLQRFERPFAALAQRRVAAIVVVGILAFVLNAANTLRQGIPPPVIQDENSYLLSADTFTHGRLANPPHQFWQHFESIHILQQPTYSSKYPPGQGLMLALGKTLGGQFIVGAWLATGLACAALCWLFYSYFSDKWALFGGLMSAFHGGIQTWGNNYWGGNLGVIGGALILGATLRLLRESSGKSGIAFGLGVGFLLYSRMFEGVILTLLLLGWLVSHFRSRFGDLGRLTIFGVAGFLPFVLFLGFYNRAVTGSAAKMPYTIHEATYGYAPLFVFQKPKSVPTYRHALMQTFHTEVSYGDWAQQQSPAGFVRGLVGKVFAMVRWLFRTPIFALALLGIPAVLRSDRTVRVLCLVLLLFCGVLTLPTWFNAHYASPVVGLLFLLLLAGFRQIAKWRIGEKPIGVNLIGAALALNLFTVVLLPPPPALSAKAILADNLLKHGGKHLVFVRYAPDHSPHDEWIYNGADIDGSPIVWAREMDIAEDRRLQEYYKDRTVWLALPDANPAKLIPYSRP